MSSTHICVFIAFCGLLSVVFQVCKGSAVVSVRFISFRTRGELSGSGKCCDGKWTSCMSPCDPVFTICLDQLDSLPKDMSRCELGQNQSSGVIKDKNIVRFEHLIGKLKNPIAWYLKKWPGQARLKVLIMDDDSDEDEDKSGDFIDMMTLGVSFTPDGPLVLNKLIKISGKHSRSELAVKVNITCSLGYYGIHCTVHCDPSEQDHYSCSLEGKKLCHEGWEGDNCNINTDDCRENPCQNGGTCHDLINGFSCACVQGFEGDNCEEDKDECAISGLCRHGSCINTEGSYSCSCFKGYSGEHCGVFTDVCDAKPCLNGGKCESFLGEFECNCPKRFKGKTCSDDVDECSEGSPCQNGGECLNTHGGFHCSCPSGLRGRLCEQDVDECQESSPCYNEATCVNTNRSYRCDCPATFKGKYCENDVNECDHSPCQNNGTCTNSHGGFSCACVAGYTGNNCTADVDECRGPIMPCQNGAVCKNSFGSFSCRCNVGYTGRLCEDDINECEAEYAMCKNGASCINLDGSFKCQCTEFWGGPVCDINVDECVSSPCSNGGVCRNIAEGFACTCLRGWRGLSCESDIDECEEAGGICQNGGSCYNIPGSYWCSCVDGWAGQECGQDVDECHVTSWCHNGGACVNTVGTFTCQCLLGWSGQRCEFDVNECLNAPDICGSNGTCYNVPGDFRCHCHPGFTGPLCNQDVDECVLFPDVCIQPGNFTFLPYDANTSARFLGSFFASNSWEAKNTTGKQGEDNSISTNKPIPSAIFSPPTTISDGATNRLVCLNGNPGYSCICQDGWAGQSCDQRVTQSVSFSSSISQSTPFLPLTEFVSTKMPGDDDIHYVNGSVLQIAPTAIAAGIIYGVTDKFKTRLISTTKHLSSTTICARASENILNTARNKGLPGQPNASTINTIYGSFEDKTVETSLTDASLSASPDCWTDTAVSLYVSTTLVDTNNSENRLDIGRSGSNQPNDASIDRINSTVKINNSINYTRNCSAIRSNINNNSSSSSSSSSSGSASAVNGNSTADGTMSDISLGSQDVDATPGLSAIGSSDRSHSAEKAFPEVSVPFYLSGQVPRRERWVVNSGLSRLLKETHLFKGKELTVNSLFASGKGSNG
ncbi:hypothetical protein RRG08_056467 [Elysia crispata]|uniref:Delta-like protein n=1 Tax=Elysia crispata TaxID=231223 RepID=A0AAE0XSI8_9GAST|nr:hypothetical protein RRG08_056467 [Elysia crispata]